jgi:protein rlx
MFEDCECVIATHTDTQTVHAHIVVNAVHPITGRKLHFNDDDYTKLKDMANEIGKEFGFSSLDFRKKAENKRTNDERHILLKGGTSWKEELREVIEEGKLSAGDESEFFAHLAKYGVKITRSGKDYSYLHPGKGKAIRGLKLGENYTKQEVLNVIDKQRNGNDGNSVTAVAGSQSEQESRIRERTTQRSVGDIKREMQRLNKQAEYAHHGLDGESEERKRRERAERERLARERELRRKRDEELARQNENAQQNNSNGNKSGNKKNDHYLECELRKTIAAQSDAVFTEVKKELDESKKMLETTREELRVQHGFRKFLFWATPILLLVQTLASIFLLLT